LFSHRDDLRIVDQIYSYASSIQIHVDISVK
jgi:hypothetical protein